MNFGNHLHGRCWSNEVDWNHWMRTSLRRDSWILGSKDSAIIGMQCIECIIEEVLRERERERESCLSWIRRRSSYEDVRSLPSSIIASYQKVSKSGRGRVKGKQHKLNWIKLQKMPTIKLFRIIYPFKTCHQTWRLWTASTNFEILDSKPLSYELSKRLIRADASTIKGFESI